ncbi:hypothetical protein PCANC_08638 [Puccinia coronata f. sp. avenae]|uniref:Uncharacterized protein n=1 Tax=Puccinia coronata f. sp. avenae TaxID=200324 RepID=A0A2N5T5Z5_9BASI|nr:hypothetical protein PCANC_08638 [Puccinia coronata f. sp. avenae]
MLSFFKQRTSNFQREAGTYHELLSDHDPKFSIPEKIDEAHSAQPIPVSNPNFDILRLPNSLTGKTRADKDFDSKISSQATGLVRKTTRKLAFSRTRAPDPQKCESIIRQLKLILSNSDSQHDQLIESAPVPSQIIKPLETPLGSKAKNKQILLHLNNPTYASKIISMLKQEPSPSYVMQPGGQAETAMPRGVCLQMSEMELEAKSVSGNDMEDVIHVTKALTMGVTPRQGIMNLITGLSVGGLMNTLGSCTGFYDALAIGSKNLIDRTDAHQELIGMVPKDRISVWCYWWGFEIALPLESLERLKTVRSIESAASQMLVALTAAGGAVELLPFIRFISAYLDMEWGAINEQNKGKGVVIAATWALPMALVPRPWDFDSPAPLAIEPLPKIAGGTSPAGLDVLVTSS